VDIPTQELGNLHDLVDLNAGAIALQFQPGDLTFEPVWHRVLLDTNDSVVRKTGF
jgi:hypothetical protein